MDNNREQLIKTIKEWVKLDNEIRTLQQEQHKRKNDKKEISKILMNIMKENNVDCFDLNDGQICYTKKNVKKPITKKMLMETLSKYFEGDLLKANDLNKFIIDSQIEEVKENITRKINK